MLAIGPKSWLCNNYLRQGGNAIQTYISVHYASTVCVTICTADFFFVATLILSDKHPH